MLADNILKEHRELKFSGKEFYNLKNYVLFFVFFCMKILFRLHKHFILSKSK